MKTQSKAMTWAGRILTALIAVMLTFSAVMKFQRPPELTEQFVNKLGYPEDLLLTIGILEISCLVVYLIPPTAVLGAVLLTGYLGGAVATHVRIHDNFWSPVIGGVLVWLALWLREPRVRALLPFRGGCCRPSGTDDLTHSI